MRERERGGYGGMRKDVIDFQCNYNLCRVFLSLSCKVMIYTILLFLSLPLPPPSAISPPIPPYPPSAICHHYPDLVGANRGKHIPKKKSKIHILHRSLLQKVWYKGSILFWRPLCALTRVDYIYLQDMTSCQ